MEFRPCAVIPSHNHYRALGSIVDHLRGQGLEVFIVDDGSTEPARSAIAALHDPEHGVTVRRLATRRGKGEAVIDGFRAAIAAGFTHAVQIDADGQHDLSAVSLLLAAGADDPAALVLGAPRYDHSAPLGRRVGRWITHLWVCVETLSWQVIDTMCGFRLYPLAPAAALLGEERVGSGMEFDTEIAVRLLWRNTRVRTVPVRVLYPADNHSNFRLLIDNLRISWMHTRLVTRLLLRSIRGPGRKKNHSRPWFALAERGSYWGLQFLALTYRVAGKRGCMAAALPIGFCFYLCGGEQRRASRQFLKRVYAARGDERSPGAVDLLRHFFSFVGRTVESFGAWVAGIDWRDLDSPDLPEIKRLLAGDRGVVLIVSHLGNIELTRAVLDERDRNRMTVLLHTRHARNFERLLRQWRPEVFANTLQVDDINPGTIVALREKIDAGGWVAIAGDRVPVSSSERISYAPFLGHAAPFPQGPYILAHLLECPVYLIFCIRERGRYAIHLERFAERIELPRRNKNAALAEWVERYARRLEGYSLRDPLQWYNFFDFWAAPPGHVKAP